MTLQFKAYVRPFQGTGALRAYATLVVNDTLLIDGFKVMESRTGDLFVAPPSHKGKDKEGKDTYFNDVRFNEEKGEGEFRGPVAEAAYGAILAAYGSAIAEGNGGRGAGRGNAGAAHQQRENPSRSRPSTGRNANDPVNWI